MSSSDRIQLFSDEWIVLVTSCCDHLEPDDLRQVSFFNSWEDIQSRMFEGQGDHSKQPNQRELAMLTHGLQRLRLFTDFLSNQLVSRLDTAIFWGLIGLILKLNPDEATESRIPRMLSGICHKIDTLNTFCGDAASLLPQTREACFDTALSLLAFLPNIVHYLRIDSRLRSSGLRVGDEWRAVEQEYLVITREIDESISRIEQLAKPNEFIELGGRSDRLKEIVRLRSTTTLSKQPTPSAINNEETAKLPCAIFPSSRASPCLDRSDVISRIEEHFPDDKFRSLALYGPGGVGKSSVALNYAETKLRSGELDAMFWVHSHKLETIRQSFTDIATRLRLPGVQRNDHDANRDIVLGWLQHTQCRWLIIYDDAGLLNNYWPAASRGQAIITTRNWDFSSDPADAGLGVTPWNAGTESEAESAMELSGELRGYGQTSSRPSGLHEGHDRNFQPSGTKSSSHSARDSSPDLRYRPPQTRHGLTNASRVGATGVSRAQSVVKDALRNEEATEAVLADLSADKSNDTSSQKIVEQTSTVHDLPAEPGLLTVMKGEIWALGRIALKIAAMIYTLLRKMRYILYFILVYLICITLYHAFLYTWDTAIEKSTEAICSSSFGPIQTRSWMPFCEDSQTVMGPAPTGLDPSKIASSQSLLVEVMEQVGQNHNTGLRLVDHVFDIRALRPRVKESSLTQKDALLKQLDSLIVDTGLAADKMFKFTAKLGGTIDRVHGFDTDAAEALDEIARKKRAGPALSDRLRSGLIALYHLVSLHHSNSTTDDAGEEIKRNFIATANKISGEVKKILGIANQIQATLEKITETLQIIAEITEEQNNKFPKHSALSSLWIYLARSDDNEDLKSRRFLLDDLTEFYKTALDVARQTTGNLKRIKSDLEEFSDDYEEPYLIVQNYTLETALGLYRNSSRRLELGKKQLDYVTRS